jgi:hypothetical protein
MTMAHSSRFLPVFIVGLGLLAAWPGKARCDEAAAGARESIIEGVRDDIRRRLKEQEPNEATSETRPATTSGGGDRAGDRPRLREPKESLPK